MSSARKAEQVDADVIAEVCALIEQRTGVQLGRKQFDMAQNRLKRRLSELGLDDFAAYRLHLKAHRAEETEALVSLLTTHHTYFFREYSQFEALEQELPAFAARIKAQGRGELAIWSAACSRGQEVYSLAMHLNRHWAPMGGKFRILGTDVDAESVKIAANGVFARNEIKEIPLPYLNEHWTRGTSEVADFVKARRTLRDHCEFDVVNLMKLNDVTRKFDVIFCRNVFIYFTPQQVKAITQELLKHLYPGGWLIIGLSESLHGQGLQVANVGPSVYSQLGDAPAATVAAPAPEAARPIRVVCIDDSPSILTLMKKIFSGGGFELLGTAANGDEGASLVKRVRPDVVTLDIHMPVCSGIEYLKRHQGPGSPPVVMVTSVARDDAGLAQEALSHGASDFVEKPTLSNLQEKSEEIRAKVKTAHRARGSKIVRPSVDRDFASHSQVKSSGRCARVVYCPASELHRLPDLWRELKSSTIATWVTVDAPEATLSEIAERISNECKCTVGRMSRGDSPQSGSVLLGSVAEGCAVLNAAKLEKISLLSLGSLPVPFHALKAAEPIQVLRERGLEAFPSQLSGRADVVPLTSFAYLSERFFGGK